MKSSGTFSASGPKPKVCIVGGGNASHVLAAWLPSRNYETYWFTSFEDEADRLNAAIAKHGDIIVEFDTITETGVAGEHVPQDADSVSVPPHLPPHGILKGHPSKISKNPADVISQADIILAPVPSFAYKKLLLEFKPYLRAGQYFGVTPGQGGFDWIATDMLGEDLYNKLNIFAVVPMPLNCRIVEFGKRVNVKSVKQNFKVSCNLTTEPDYEGSAGCPKKVCRIVRDLFDAENVDHIGNIIGITLYPINAVIHPARNYSILGSDYCKGQLLPVNPYFYEEMDESSSGNIEAVSCEVQRIGDALAKAAEAAHTELLKPIPSIFDFLKFVYGEKYKSLKDVFATNPAYKGFRAPLKQVGDGWQPDFNDRYYSEDIPMLCLLKGVADLVNVNVPMIDTIIVWAQRHMDKEYIVDNKLVGKDVKETPAPQKFGIDNKEKLIAFYLKSNHKLSA